MATNPILTELSQLSPGAQQALVQAHGAMGGPAASVPTPTAAPRLTAPTSEPAPVAPNLSGMGGSAMPSLQAPPAPNIVKAPAPRGTLEGDEAERSRLLSTGPGISQIHSKIENALPNHPILGKVLGYGAEVPARLAEAAGSMFAPVRSAEQLLPGTQAHHAMELRNLNSVIEKESQEGLQGAQAGAANANAAHERVETTGLPQQQADAHAAAGSRLNLDASEIAEHNAQAASLLHPQAKTDFEAWQQQNPGKPIEDWIKVSQKPTQVPPEQQYLTEYAQKHPGSTVAEAERHYMLDTQRPTQAAPVNLFVPGEKPGTETLQTVRPGQTVVAGAQTAAGLNSVNTPTAQQRTAAGRAETVVAMAPEVLSRIDALAPKLGPIEGRWNEFMQGKVGSDDPDFAALRSDLLMFSSGVALAHAQGRLPENLRLEFDHAINSPKQTPENLKATINAMLPWLQKMQQQGQPNPARGESSPARPSGVPDNYQWNPQGNGGKGSWRAPQQ